MYSVTNYGEMAADGVRMDAYARALERAVKPGCVVLDIGAGTGIFSLLAARAGARRVHAVDPNPAIWILAELARENGLADRITIHHTTSYELDLPERADVIISDLRGSISLHDEHLAVLRDAKKRLLAPGGILMPQKDDLFVGLCEDEALARYFSRTIAGFERRGCSAAAARRSTLNTPTRDSESGLRSTNLLTTSARWSTIEYGTESRPIEGEVELTARRAGTAHELAIWFAATIMDELGFSTEPGASMVYGRMILPLLEPVEISACDIVNVILRVDETGQRWAWETTITTPGHPPKARFRQSSFFGKPTSPEALLRTSSSFAPVPSARGERAKQALQWMDGSRSVSEITDAICEASGPTTLPRAAILEEVRELAARYGR